MTYDWTKNPILPRANMVFWHQFEDGVSADGDVNDYSGNGLDYTTAANKSVLTADALNGQPGWYFNGSRDPMINSDGAVFKHLFILASAEEAAFTDYRGLFSDDTSLTILVGDTGVTRFFDNSSSITIDYRKADVGFPQSNQEAPMSLKPAVIEITAPGGISMPNLQVGKQTSFDRRWKGFWFEDLAYSQVLNDMQRQRVYEYFAMRFQVWSMNADRFDVFPFAANRTRSEDFDQESFLSQPYSGEPKELVRGSYKGDYSLSFILREQFEYEAAKAFLKQHGKSSPFIFRDYRYFPYKEVLVNRSSSLREQGSEVTYRFNYTFDVSEVDEIQAEEISPPPPPTGFHVVSTTSTSVTLDWDSDPDNLLGGGEQLLGGGEELFV